MGLNNYHQPQTSTPPYSDPVAIQVVDGVTLTFIITEVLDGVVIENGDKLEGKKFSQSVQIRLSK